MKYVLFSLSDEIILPRQKGVALKNGQKGKLTNSTCGWQIANDPLKGGFEGEVVGILSMIKTNVTFHHINCKATDVINAESPKLSGPIKFLIP
jgi:hypothetical protein